MFHEPTEGEIIIEERDFFSSNLADKYTPEELLSINLLNCNNKDFLMSVQIRAEGALAALERQRLLGDPMKRGMKEIGGLIKSWTKILSTLELAVTRFHDKHP